MEMPRGSPANAKAFAARLAGVPANTKAFAARFAGVPANAKAFAARLAGVFANAQTFFFPVARFPRGISKGVLALAWLP